MPERRSREKRRKNGRKGGLLLLMGARGAHGEDRRGERHPFNFHLGTGNFRRERKRRRRARGGRREDTARLKEHHSVLHPISFSPNPASTPSTEVAWPFFYQRGNFGMFSVLPCWKRSDGGSNSWKRHFEHFTTRPPPAFCFSYDPLPNEIFFSWGSPSRSPPLPCL